MLLSIKDLSQYMSIKPSTLYAWASRGKIPCMKIHGLIRFRKEEIDQWLDSCYKESPDLPDITSTEKPLNIDALIERVKREVYNTRNKNGRPDRVGEGGERKGRHGAV